MTTLLTIPRVPLMGPDADLFTELVSVWQRKRSRNLLRTMYYEGKNALKDFGISVPPQMQSAFTPLQWIAKGVHALTDRSVLEGFVSASGSGDPFGLLEVIDDNDLLAEFAMASRSSAIHATSFLTVTQGDVAAGEPAVLVLPRSAEVSAALWDHRRRAIKGFLSLVDFDELGPVEMAMYTPERVYQFTKARGVWEASWSVNPLGEVPVVPLVFDADLARPFGHSRITRTAMGLTDAAVRTILRSEVSAEFYAADKYWLFGADVSKFVGDDRWSALMGRMNALDIDNPEQMPKLERFTGSSPQPHVDQLRMITSLFADDQSLDVKWADSSNPSSADAIYAAKEELIMKTRNANRGWGRAAVRAAQFAVRLRDNVQMSDELRSLSARFTDPAIVSPSGRADAFSKLAASIEGFGASRTGLEYAGLSQEQITQFLAERDRAGASSRIQQLVEAARGARSETPAMGAEAGDSDLTEAQVLKAKADALGVLRRAGVDAADAARLAGLDDVKFIPGQPITIKTAEE